MTYNIEPELMEEYKSAKEKHPNIDHEMVMMFAEDMPDEFEMVIMKYKYGCHIGSKRIYEDFVSSFKNPDGSMGAHWDIDTIKGKTTIDFNSKEYTLWDFAYQVNMHYSDYGEKIGTDMLFWMAKKDLEDVDYPGNPSERAYKDGKKRLKHFKDSNS